MPPALLTPPISLTEPATLMRPDAARLVAFADRLQTSGDEDLSHVVRRAADGLSCARRFPAPRGPLDEAHRWG